MGGELTKAANARGSLEASTVQASKERPSALAHEDDSEEESQLY